MKTLKLLPALLLTLLLAVNAWGTDDANISAASNAVNCLTQFYSAVAELPEMAHGNGKAMKYKTTLAYIQENKATVISAIVRAKGGYDIARADQIIHSMIDKSASGLGYTTTPPMATEEMYYDKITKHRYIKKDVNTYAEYTRKGAFFKNVSSCQPHLAKSPYVHPVEGDCYFLYVKPAPEIKQHIILPVKENHPEGWFLEKALVAFD